MLGSSSDDDLGQQELILSKTTPPYRSTPATSDGEDAVCIRTVFGIAGLFVPPIGNVKQTTRNVL